MGEEEECGPPAVEALSEAFAWLGQAGFPDTGRLPLFAARHWSASLERRAFSRFRRGLDNVEEVAAPRWYWRGLAKPTETLFRALTLAKGPVPTHAALDGLLSADRTPRWRVVCRFGRYVLHSRPETAAEQVIYFGDDTLFLMEGARRLLSGMSPPLRFLDLCCGGGGVGLSLPPFQGELVGVDVNGAALELANLAARAQGLGNYGYQQGDAASVLDQRFDLIVGNPPTLPPDLGGQPTLYATGSSSQFLVLLRSLLDALTPRGQALLTIFSTADGQGKSATDPLRPDLRAALGTRRAYSYTVRRQFPLGGNRWLRHVALEIEAEGGRRGETFRDPASHGMQLPGLAWRRRP